MMYLTIFGDANAKMTELKEQFGRRVRLLRLHRDMTQEQLAEAAAISVDFLSLIERGQNAPSFTSLQRIANALGVPVYQLFRFNEEWE